MYKKGLGEEDSMTILLMAPFWKKTQRDFPVYKYHY